jgi:hypothetical protein
MAYNVWPVQSSGDKTYLKSPPKFKVDFRVLNRRGTSTLQNYFFSLAMTVPDGIRMSMLLMLYQYVDVTYTDSTLVILVKIIPSLTRTALRLCVPQT